MQTMRTPIFYILQHLILILLEINLKIFAIRNSMNNNNYKHYEMVHNNANIKVLEKCTKNLIGHSRLAFNNYE